MGAAPNSLGFTRQGVGLCACPGSPAATGGTHTSNAGPTPSRSRNDRLPQHRRALRPVPGGMEVVGLKRYSIFDEEIRAVARVDQDGEFVLAKDALAIEARVAELEVSIKVAVACAHEWAANDIDDKGGDVPPKTLAEWIDHAEHRHFRAALARTEEGA